MRSADNAISRRGRQSRLASAAIAARQRLTDMIEHEAMLIGLRQRRTVVAHAARLFGSLVEGAREDNQVSGQILFGGNGPLVKAVRLSRAMYGITG